MTALVLMLRLRLLGTMWTTPLASLLLATRVTLRTGELGFGKVRSRVRTGPMQSRAGVTSVLSSCMLLIRMLRLFWSVLKFVWVSISWTSEQLPSRGLEEGRVSSMLFLCIWSLLSSLSPLIVVM